MNPRHAAVIVLSKVLEQGRNLPDALQEVTAKVATSDKALLQAICYGVIRLYPRLFFISQQLISKPLKAKDSDVLYLILVGLYQLEAMRIPDHAAVSETVAVTGKLKKPWAKALVNAVLRNYQRQTEQLSSLVAQDLQASTAHPQWWLQRFQQDWPQQWQQIADANNQAPPMTLRLNIQKFSRENYLDQLRSQQLDASAGSISPAAITLDKPQLVQELPGFTEGLIAVQDEAAQLAALLLHAQPGERILDACAAPGGKTVHILESQPALAELVALDIDQQRLDRVAENLQRAMQQATLVCGNSATPDQWWDGKPFDRILLDAPCSASGVIRRHPDIKLLRQPEDIPRLVEEQWQILNALWPLLKSGGMLLYVTCSVFKAENSQQIARFIALHDDAQLIPLQVSWGQRTEAGTQILPGEQGMDGFFYAQLCKR